MRRGVVERWILEFTSPKTSQANRPGLKNSSQELEEWRAEYADRLNLIHLIPPPIQSRIGFA